MHRTAKWIGKTFILSSLLSEPYQQQTSSPKLELDFPLNFIVNTIPAEATPQTIPPVSKLLEYGAYLVNASACFDCHTNVVDGTPVEGMDFAGGREFKLSGGSVFTANITPDKETGIGQWTKQQFVERFKAYADPGHSQKTVSGSEFQTIMPWTMYGGMKARDLEAIYTYLRSVKPIKNEVTKFLGAVKIKTGTWVLQTLFRRNGSS